MLNPFYTQYITFTSCFYNNVIIYECSNFFVNYFNIIIVILFITNALCIKSTEFFLLILLYLNHMYYLSFSTIRINLGLINTLSIWHPVVLYITLSYNIQFIYNSKKVSHFFTIVSLLFLLLGSWWSSQELLWLGWWNWDGVENSLLICILTFFYISHFRIYKYNYIVFCKMIYLTILLYFFIVNKTNIYKSIHSFTNSVTSVYSTLNYIYIIIYIIYILYREEKKIFYYYYFMSWIPYFIYLFVWNSNILTQINFFYVLNYFLLTLITLLIKPSIFVLNIFFVSQKFWLYCIIYLCLLPASIKYFKTVHIILIFFSFIFLTILLSNTLIIFNLLFNLDMLLTNCTTVNHLAIFSVNNTITGNLYQRDFTSIIFKNLNSYSKILFLDKITGLTLIAKQTKLVSVAVTFVFLYLVIKVFYLQQKLRFKYYINMYLFKSDLLINQQKLRRVQNKISKFNWATKSIFERKIFLFTLSHQNTIDLRFYKLLLRKVKKKFLKFKIKSYVYILPNNKTSHKSKNSRMGKGKGMNDRFYYRHKLTKPIIVFNKLSFTRFVKLKNFLIKFFRYKYY